MLPFNNEILLTYCQINEFNKIIVYLTVNGNQGAKSYYKIPEIPKIFWNRAFSGIF